MQRCKVLQRSDGKGYIVFDSNSLQVFQFSGTSDQLGAACIRAVDKAKPAQAALHEDVKRCETLTVMLTNACNLNCKYCYFHFHPSEEFERIDTEAIISAYKKLLEHFADGVEYIQFFGGEPLLHFPVIQEVTEQIISHAKDTGVLCPRFGINTNGLLLKKEVMDFFQAHNFFVRISIDGTEENSAMRVNYQDKASYSELVKVIKWVKNNYPDFPLHAEMTYSAQHIKNYLSTYIHDVEVLRDLGFSSIHMAPVITPDSHDESNVFSDIKLFFTRA